MHGRKRTVLSSSRSTRASASAAAAISASVVSWEKESRTEQCASVEAAGAAWPALLAGGDLVLLKGSRGMAMERLVGPIRSAFGDGEGEDGVC